MRGQRGEGLLRRRSLERRKAVLWVDDGQRVERGRLLDALASCPSPAAVVVLRFYEGMTQSEIADGVDLRLGTVKSSLHRGLAELREALEP